MVHGFENREGFSYRYGLLEMSFNVSVNGGPIRLVTRHGDFEKPTRQIGRTLTCGNRCVRNMEYWVAMDMGESSGHG